jgi:flavin-dependent thymidylate synthase
MKVILAGHNGDIEAQQTEEFSPETLSAAYARISRSSDPVPTLRKKARVQVESARRSNQTIVFGLGHHSVAEHAVFNFDILGISRLAIEALEWHRLCSYTEKSQRYITLDDDWVMPPEFDAHERNLLKSIIEVQNACYHSLLPKLIDAQREANPDLLKRKQDIAKVEGWAKEDARYVVSLATEGQLGFTANARNLELIVRRFRTSPLEEVRELGRMLFEHAKKVAPSLIILADKEGFEKAHGTSLEDTYFQLAASDLHAAAKLVPMSYDLVPLESGDVKLIQYTPNPDAAVISALLFADGRGSLSSCQYAAESTGISARERFIARTLENISKFDSPPRAFEEAVFRFEVIADASAFAQIKRHRMSTQQWGPYDPGLGVTVPPMIEEIGEKPTFMSIMDQAAEAWWSLKGSLVSRGESNRAADYVLTNAHCRRVSITMNLREIYHFSRMREDIHAQWAIRKIANDVTKLVRLVAPGASILLAGKHDFDKVAQKIKSRA